MSGPGAQRPRRADIEVLSCAVAAGALAVFGAAVATPAFSLLRLVCSLLFMGWSRVS